MGVIPTLLAVAGIFALGAAFGMWLAVRELSPAIIRSRS